MTTSFTTGTVAHTDDATFRTWGQAVRAILLAIGWINTADTGQINWTTVVRPGTSTAAGYEIYYLNDSLHGTAPIYMKIEYGTATAATVPAIWITIGIGTNGAGTINSPTKTSRFQASYSSGLIAGTLERHACLTEGAAWMVFHADATSAGSQFAFGVFRTCDAAGTPTAEGCVLYCRGTSASAVPNVQALRFASPATVFASDGTGAFVVIPHNVTSSLDGTTMQFAPHWMPCPTWRPVRGIFSYIATELTRGTVLEDFTPFGVTPHDYMPLGGAQGFGAANAAAYGTALIWE